VPVGANKGIAAPPANWPIPVHFGRREKIPAAVGKVSPGQNHNFKRIPRSFLLNFPENHLPQYILPFFVQFQSMLLIEASNQFRAMEKGPNLGDWQFAGREIIKSFIIFPETRYNRGITLVGKNYFHELLNMPNFRITYLDIGILYLLSLTPGCPASFPWVGLHSIGNPKSGNVCHGHPNARTNIGADVAKLCVNASYFMQKG
jgi:hypothetical protein